MAHELLSLFVDVVGVNENFSDVRLEVVADRANHEIAFFNDQEGGRIHAFVFLAERTDGSGDEVASVSSYCGVAASTMACQSWRR